MRFINSLNYCEGEGSIRFLLINAIHANQLIANFLKTNRNHSFSKNLFLLYAVLYYADYHAIFVLIATK